METYSVSCHCGRVRANFRRERNLPLTAWDCNCSDCAMRRNLHFMVRASDFWLADGDVDGGDAGGPEREVAPHNGDAPSWAEQKFERETILYQWGTKTAIRRFCRTCGILPFYVPRSNPDGYGITLPCVDWGAGGPPPIVIRSFDGINWERSHADTGIAKETTGDE